MNHSFKWLGMNGISETPDSAYQLCIVLPSMILGNHIPELGYHLQQYMYTGLESFILPISGICLLRPLYSHTLD